MSTRRRPALQTPPDLDRSYKTRNRPVEKHGLDVEGQNTQRAKFTRIDLQGLDRVPAPNRRDT